MDEELQATLPTESADTSLPSTDNTDNAAAAPSMEETIRDTYRALNEPKAERVRGADGKYARAAQDDAGEAQEAPATDAAPEDAEAQPVAAVKPHDAAPNTWRKELAAEFGTLPEHVREEIHRREADFHKGIGQYKEAAGFGHAMFEDVSPHFDAMRQLGATPQQVVREVLGTWRNLVSGSPDQKRATLSQLANAYGIPLSEVQAPPNGASAAAPEIAPVLQRLQRLEASITESQHQREQAEQAALLSQAEKFLSDPKREHLDAVFDDVLALVRSGVPPEDAYDKAIWAHPETRTKLMAKQDAERRTREAAEAAAARKAALSNVTRRGTPPAVARTGSMEDTIRQTYRQLQS